MTADKLIGATIRLESGVHAEVLERIEDEHGTVYLVRVAETATKSESVLTLRASEIRSLEVVNRTPRHPE